MKTRPVPKFVDRSTLAHWHSYTTPTIALLGSLHHYHSVASCASKKVILKVGCCSDTGHKAYLGYASTNW